MDLGAWNIPSASGQQQLRFGLQNNSSDSSLVLVLRNPYLRALRVVWEPEGAATMVVHTGIQGGFGQRPTRTPLFRIPLPIDPGSTGTLRLYLDNKGHRGRCVVSVQSPAASQRERRQRTAVLAFYLSGGVFTLLFGFFILAFVRAYIRFSYGFFFAASLGLVVANQGIGYALLWPMAEGWQGVAEGVLLNAALLGGTRFIQRFLKPEQDMPWTRSFLFWLMAGFALFSSLWLWAPQWSPLAFARFQWANDAFMGFGLVVLTSIPFALFARTRHWEAAVLWLTYAVLIGTIGVQKVDALGWGPAKGWGPGLEKGLWAGMVILHAGTTILVLHRMRRVVLGQAQAKAELDTARVRLLRALVLQEETERLRIGADLHDEAGSRFAALKMQLSGLAFDLPPGLERGALEELIHSVDALSHANRQLAHRMLSVSLDKLGLKDALQAYRQRLIGEGRHVVLMLGQNAPARGPQGPASRSQDSADVLSGSDDTAQRLLYRVVQEIVEGLFADAPELRIRLENADASGQWLLTVEAQEEDVPLPSPDRQGPAYQGLSARTALFSSQREHAMEWKNGTLRLWLPKRVVQG